MATKIDPGTLESIKMSLANFIQEWVGSSAPEEGDDEFAKYEGFYADLDAVETVRDVVYFLEGFWQSDADIEEFLASYDLTVK